MNADKKLIRMSYICIIFKLYIKKLFLCKLGHRWSIQDSYGKVSAFRLVFLFALVFFFPLMYCLAWNTKYTIVLCSHHAYFSMLTIGHYWNTPVFFKIKLFFISSYVWLPWSRISTHFWVLRKDQKICLSARHSLIIED